MPYSTIAAPSQGVYREKMSRFLAFALPVESAGEARAQVAEFQNKYHDARHVCWAYMVGPERTEFMSNDNGEPSGTAGRPILGQINSFGLTNVVVIVVRYFGGIKLGTSGLISAYKEAARLALAEAEIIERHAQAKFEFTFPYSAMGAVMPLVKEPGITILDRDFGNTCRISLTASVDDMPRLRNCILNIDGVTEAG